MTANATGRGAPAVLVLESGRAFFGTGFGAAGDALGEVVFNTAMTGYQEILTDPSYAGQIVVMTAPHIGNTGINDEDMESARPACAGLVVREASHVTSSWRATGDLHAALAAAGVVGIEGIDTRALTRAIATDGAQRGIVATASAAADIAALVARVKASPNMAGRDLVGEVTCPAPYTFGEGNWRAPDLEPVAASRSDVPLRAKIVVWDFGAKREILRDLCELSLAVEVVPAATSAAEILARNPDGVLLSNGPGDPAAVTYAIREAGLLCKAGVPILGICLGHQILALALGARTYKLGFGHHGGNHPVKDLATGKVEITSQNHGFSVDAESLPQAAEITHINLYDQTVEGFRLTDRPITGIQYHPEASPGPHDAEHLFARFAGAARGARR